MKTVGQTKKMNEKPVFIDGISTSATFVYSYSRSTTQFLIIIIIKRVKDDIIFVLKLIGFSGAKRDSPTSSMEWLNPA